ncbi:MAG: GAF domain-containing protein [Deltaproteobacteria bacterium]|nr:GAF domain-containing protein [Deltaproteobacteria bacterium]
MAEKDYFEALYQVGRVVNSSLEPSRVLEEIARCVSQTMEVKGCSLRLLDQRRQRLLMGAFFGLSEGYIRKGPVLIEESGLDREALEGRTVYLADAQTDEGWQYPEKAKAEGIHSVLVVPLTVDDEVIGVLRAYAAEVREFGQRERRFLEAVGNISAIALENARLHQALKKDYDLLIEHEYRLDDN